MHKKAKASFWTAGEMDLSKDVHDWNNGLNDNERHFIPHVLTFPSLNCMFCCCFEYLTKKTLYAVPLLEPQNHYCRVFSLQLFTSTYNKKSNS
jgi:hypothetical protein